MFFLFTYIFLGETSSNLSGMQRYTVALASHHAGVFHRIAFYVVEAVEAETCFSGGSNMGAQGLGKATRVAGFRAAWQLGKRSPKKPHKIEKSWNCGEPNVGN